MKKQVVISVVVFIFVLIIYMLFPSLNGNNAKTADSQKTTDTNTEITKEDSEDNSNEITVEDALYAADSNAFDKEGYTKLLTEYKELQAGQDVKLDYDFKCREFKALVRDYKLEEIAGEGSEFERAVRLMDHFAPRLAEEPNYDNHVEPNAIDLLDYCLDEPKNGLNSFAQSKILAEMCLSLSIYARRVWLMPYSSRDTDYHVVTEIYDTGYEKWILLDMTNDCYSVDQEGTPLSVLEIREHSVDGGVCTCMRSSFTGNGEEAAKEYEEINTNYRKNLFYIALELYNGYGMRKQDECDIVPAGYDVHKRYVASAIWQTEQCKKDGEDQEYIDQMNKYIKEIKKHKEYYNVISPNAMKISPVKK